DPAAGGHRRSCETGPLVRRRQGPRVRERRARRGGAGIRRAVRILLVNWNDRENPHAGGVETHLHEIFGRLARGGHTIDLVASGSKSFIRASIRSGTPPTPPNRGPANRRSCTWAVSSVIKEWRSRSGRWRSHARRAPTWSSRSPEGGTIVGASSAWHARWAWATSRGSSGS